MMKRVSATAVLCGVLCSGNALAGEWNIGASLGSARGDTGTGDLNRELAARGLNATASSSDDSRTAWRLYFGYDYTPNWGVEAGYVDLGEVTTTFTGTATDIDAFLAASGDVHPNTAQGWQLSAVYRQVLGSPRLHAVARLGAFAWSSQYTLQGVGSSRDVDERGTNLSVGLGLQMGLDEIAWMPPGFAGHLDWDRYSIDGEPIDLLSLGLSYRFR